MKAVFCLGIMVLAQISRSRFKQSKIYLLIPHIYVLGCSVNFLVIKGLVKFMEMGNFEDLMLLPPQGFWPRGQNPSRH